MSLLRKLWHQVHVARRAVGLEHKRVYLAPCALLRAHTAPPRLTYREATLDELARLPLEAGYNTASLAELAPRLAAGDRLILGELDHQPVFSGWVSERSIELPREGVPLPPGLAYAYRLFTNPEARGHGAMRGFYAHLAAERLRPDTVAIVASVATTNTGSQHAHAQVGFVPVGSFWHLRLGRAAAALLDRRLARRLGRRLVFTVSPDRARTAAR